VAHARAKLTVLGRQLLVERVLTDGWKPADAAKAMGVSRQTATSGCAVIETKAKTVSSIGARPRGAVLGLLRLTRWPGSSPTGSRL
jgi:hypothetical protein